MNKLRFIHEDERECFLLVKNYKCKHSSGLGSCIFLTFLHMTRNLVTYLSVNDYGKT